jgi:cytochrome c
MTEPGRENRGTYGGGGNFNLPIEHHLSFIAESSSHMARLAQAKIGNHQPRALVYDGKRDMLFVSGYGSDDIIALADASRPSIRFAWRALVPPGKEGCGPTGMDVADNGDVLVHCALSRTIARVDVPKSNKRRVARAVLSKELTRSRLSKAARAGRRLFRMGRNIKLSALGAMACESCHPEGRTDGLSWRIGGRSLQTPMLAARIIGTHPFKWDGGDKNLQISLRSTVTRLGGRGISTQEAKNIQAFLQSLPRPRRPTVKNKAAVARGKKLFNSKAIGCAKCHNGPKLTNGKKYDVAENMPKGVDTPSLIGLANSAPYYHDGSAATLRALLLQNGTIHSMGRPGKLQGKQIDDLIAYLETL